MKKYLFMLIGLLFVSTIPHVSFASDVAPTKKVCSFDVVDLDHTVISFVLVKENEILPNSIVESFEFVIGGNHLRYSAINTNTFSNIIDVGLEPNLLTHFYKDDTGTINTIPFNKRIFDILATHFKRE